MSAITNTDSYLSKVHRINTTRSTLSQAITALSLIVILVVFWSLKLTGITMAGEAFCGIDEHIHGENCPTGSLICPLEETEGHIHDESCILCELLCELEETLPHVHGEECLHYEQICTEEETEPHTHSDSCRALELICTEEESETHTHSDSCYIPGEELLCGLEETEGHAHTEECFLLVEGSYICGMEETEGHAHNEACYYHGIGFGCGQTEAEGHIHTEDCLTAETELGCGLDSIPAHFHLEECYETLEECPLEEHIHTEECYCNLDVDAETIDDWEATLPDLSQETSTGAAVVSVARSQLDYTESTLNFEVDVQGIRRGITRYGQWYGNPYGDWSAMFASFCLHYGGAEDLPANAGPESMRLEWEEEDLYLPYDEYEPVIGDLLFLTEADEEGFYGDTAAAVAIVTETDEYGMTVIQGDLDDTVAEYYIEADDPAILGYGIVPESSPFALLMAPRAGENAFLANTINYNANMFTADRRFVIYAKYNNQYYALVNESNNNTLATAPAVPITLDADGRIYADVDNPDTLLWTFTADGNNYDIKNVATGRYLHPGGDGNIIQTGDWPVKLDQDGTGAKFVHTSANNDVGIRFNTSNTNNLVFDTTTKGNASTLYFGVSETCTVWLDGTQGGLSAFGGSPNQKYTVFSGDQMSLPAEWESPSKYKYVLQGWYDVTNDKYYAPGDTVTITENSVFYADWKAETYDIGVYNAHVADTVTTNSFITTQVFDYNYLFNVLSADSTVTITDSGHTENWSIIQKNTGDGKVDYEDRTSLDFIFLDYGGNNTLDYPGNRRDGVNQFPGAGKVTSGIYNASIYDALFSLDDSIPGKTYLGTGDHLFQIDTDPNSEHYGYYYYDSSRNAASYNQSAQRFYVYDYLEATSAELSSTKTDFMPFNSPYANANGKTVDTYESKYVYDAKYNTSEDHVSSNYAFGMKIDIDFYLPTTPGDNGNKDLYGNDLVFSFSGDDDLWVLVDGKLALDIGGIHQAETGEINFNTGKVTVQGKEVTSLSDVVSALPSGAHTLTVMYLERGATHSNCAIHFNLAPRYGFTIQKEDVLTSQYLNGAEFSVYTDLECLTAAKLYNTREDSNYPDRVTNSFEVVNGKATMWGLSPGTTYYIKETHAPANADYDLPKGIIRMALDKSGNATYDVIILEEDGSISGGFTIHGFRISEEEQQAFIVATNAPEWVEEVTTVEARKVWADGSNHSNETISVYLTRIERDENGEIKTVYRLQEAEISAATDWTHIWENLPKYYDEAKTRPVEYGVEEEYVPGYQSKVEKVGSYETTTTAWMPVTDLNNLDTSKTYLLATSSGYLSTDKYDSSNNGTGYKWVSQEEALKSDLAQWKITKNGSTYKLTNKQGQIITFYYGNGNYITDFFAYTGNADNNRVQYFKFTTPSSDGRFRIFYDASSDYYIADMKQADGKFNNSTTESSGLLFTLYTETTTTSAGPVVGEQAFQVTNTPLESSKETSLTVRKVWNLPQGADASLYEQEQVTIKLLANGKDTGRTVTLNLKNNWEATFQGLPYTDANGVIDYTVEELWNDPDWTMQCETVTTDSNPPTYETTVTNTYQPKIAELPSTGSMSRTLYMLCGSSLMLFSLVYGFASRRTRERRTK